MRPMIFCNQGGLMIKEEFYFDSRDGENRIHAVRYTPDDGNVRGIVQIVHGMAEYVERYENLAEFLTKRGILVTGEDHLGHGKSVSEGGSFGYFCEQDPATVVVRDVHRLKKITEEQYPQVPYIILGHSMGSFIARNYLCRYGSGIDGAVIVGTGMQSSGLILPQKPWRGYRSCSAVRSMSAILLTRLPSEAITNELILPELPATGSAGIRIMWTAILQTNCADLPLP